MAIGPARAILGLVLDSSSHVLDRARVRDCMHHGIFNCDPDVPLAEAAAIMAARDVRAVAVRGRDGTHGIDSDVDIVGAVGPAGAEQLSAKDVAAAEATARFVRRHFAL
jgi:CBS domain-containing protein